MILRLKPNKFVNPKNIALLTFKFCLQIFIDKITLSFKVSDFGICGCISHLDCISHHGRFTLAIVFENIYMLLLHYERSLGNLQKRANQKP